MEYGWNYISSKEYEDIQIQKNMQEKVDKLIQELTTQNQEAIRELQESLHDEKSKEVYNNLIEESLQLLQIKEIVELDSETSSRLEKIKGRYIKEIPQEIKSIHKELEESGNIQQFSCKISEFLNKLVEKINKEFSIEVEQLEDKYNKIMNDQIEELRGKLLEYIKNQEQDSAIEEKLRLVIYKFFNSKLQKRHKISIQIDEEVYLIKKEIIQEAFKISINHQEITQEGKEKIQSIINHVFNLIMKSHYNASWERFQKYTK